MDWTPYLKSICCDSRYALSRECFTPLDVLDRRTERFLLDLRVRTVLEATPELKERQEQKVERCDVLDGLRRHATEHVLLVGRPGSGKSTALQRLLLEEAERALGDANACIPVLLELRHYEKSTLDSLGGVLDEFVEPQYLPGWLRQGRLLLLVDGINELPSGDARLELAKFRQKYRATPMIFTTRELMVGGDLKIGKQLVMEPLTEPQMQQFVRAYLGDDGNKLLRQLQGRLRELAEVPLLLWMLCSLFQETRERRLPENLGLALRQFTALYDRQLKGDAPVSDESRAGGPGCCNDWRSRCWKKGRNLPSFLSLLAFRKRRIG
jgi:predicted NACHT family NTPase